MSKGISRKGAKKTKQLFFASLCALLPLCGMRLFILSQLQSIGTGPREQLALSLPKGANPACPAEGSRHAEGCYTHTVKARTISLTVT
jgi:hypothetical protein